MGEPVKFQNPFRGSLISVNLSGVIVPWTKIVGKTKVSTFKLVSNSGLEYAIIPDPEWKGVLSWYSWEEVRVLGLLNTDDLTLMVMRVFPKGPKGEKDLLIDLLSNKGREVVKKLKKSISDLVLVPAAMRAEMVC